MAKIESWKNKAEIFLKVFIGINALILLTNFVHTQFEDYFFFPSLGRKLNNPLAALLIALFLLGALNVEFRERWLGRLKKLVSALPQRRWLFAALVSIVAVLEIMYFSNPDPLWNLNAEMSYGTHFATVQLFFLGLVTLLVARRKNRENPAQDSPRSWKFIAVLFFFLALDDCVAIHENFIKWSRQIFPTDSAAHLIYEWLWFYGPFIIFAAGYMVYIFLRHFKPWPKSLAALFAGWLLWIVAIVLEALSKTVTDPMGQGSRRLFAGLEEGAEMLGATLMLLGFSVYLSATQTKTTGPPHPESH